MALLDGKHISDTDINPAKHKFIGMFREPLSLYTSQQAYIACPCGTTLTTVQQTMEHWQLGHFDVPQYIII